MCGIGVAVGAWHGRGHIGSVSRTEDGHSNSWCWNTAAVGPVPSRWVIRDGG